MRDLVEITVYDNGKVVHHYSAHNLWVDRGRKYLAELITYDVLPSIITDPPTSTERDDRIRYIGFGIGGVGQAMLTIVNAPPFSTDYPGTNSQRNIHVEATALERPVRLLVSPDVWLANLEDFGFPTVAHGATNEATYRVFLQGSTHFDLGTYTSMPLSEIALFTDESGVSESQSNNPMVAYHTFDTIQVTTSVDIEVVWTVRF
jgi:hypothetical protein